MIKVRREIQLTGTAPFTYQWINNTTECAVSFTEDQGTVTGLVLETDVEFLTEDCVTAADIDLQLTDANGCTNTFDIAFTNPCDLWGITSFGEQLKNDLVTFTMFHNNTSALTFEWNYDDTLFDFVQQVDNKLILKINKKAFTRLDTLITGKAIDSNTGCESISNYTFQFCSPSNESANFTICNEDIGASNTQVLVATPCKVAIDWTSLDITLPNGLDYTVSNDNELTIIVVDSIANGNYTGRWSVADIYNNISSSQFLNIELTSCGTDISCISSPNLMYRPTCEDVSSLPADLLVADLDDVVVFSECEPDWSTFEFVALPGQVASGTGTSAQLTTGSGTVTFNSDHEIMYNITSTGGTITIQYRLYADNADQTGVVEIAVNQDCYQGPVAVDDAFTIDCEEPFDYLDILANDTGDIAVGTVVITKTPNISETPLPGASVTVNGDGEVKVTPPSNYVGTFNFCYRVRDNNGTLSNEAEVIITVICAGLDTIIQNCDL